MGAFARHCALIGALWAVYPVRRVEFGGSDGGGGLSGAEAALSPGGSDGCEAQSPAKGVKGSRKGRRSKIGGLFASMKGILAFWLDFD